MKRDRKSVLARWFLLLPWMVAGAAQAQGDTFDPSITGPARVVADRAYAAYLRGDYALAKAMAQAALRLSPDSDSVRRLLAVTENGGTRGSRWTNPFVSASEASVKAAATGAPAAATSPSKVASPVRENASPVLSAQTAASTGGSANSVAQEPRARQPASRVTEADHAARQEARNEPKAISTSSKGVAAQKVYDLIKSGEAPAAARAASGSLQTNPADRRMWEAYVNALFAEGKHHEADEAITKAMKRFGPDERLNALRMTVRSQIEAESVSGDGKETSGWAVAAQAYKDFDRGDFAAAARGAMDAVRLAPENRDYRQLLIYALQAADRFDEANTAIIEATQRFGEDTRWTAVRSAVRGRLAVKPAENVYRALERDDTAEAIRQARIAVDFAPDVSQYHGLLIHVLLRSNQFTEAEVAATQAIQVDPEDATPRILRAYARQRLEQFDKAAEDFDTALALPDIDDVEQRSLRLIAVDAALAANDLPRAQKLMAHRAFETAPADEALAAALSERRRRLQAATMVRSSTPALQNMVTQLPEPLPNCRLTPYGRVCILMPGQTATSLGYAAAAEAYRAVGTKNFLVAGERAREAVAQAPANLSYRQLLVSVLQNLEQWSEAEQEITQALTLSGQDVSLLLQRGRIRQKLGKTALAREDFETVLKAGGVDAVTEISLLADLGRQPQARKRLAEAVDKQQLAKVSDIDLAYLSTRAGDDERALEAFDRSDKNDQLPAQSLADAAFAAIRLKMDTAAIGYFKRSIDAADELQFRTDEQSVFNTRRAVAELSREFGAVVGLSLRGTGSLTGGAASSAGAFTDSVVAGVEGYWRPWGYRAGQYAEVFARGFYTLRDKAGGLTGTDSLVGAVGARWKPLSEHTFIMSVWRQMPVSSALRSDWVAQASYFTGTGLDLRVIDQSWWTAQISADVGRYIQQQQTYGLLGARLGRSFRMDGFDSKLVIQPHAVLAAEYNSGAIAKSAVGLGPGLNLRYWYRESKYVAPMSYVDLSLQYRARVGGDQRAKGPFVTLTTSY